MGDAVLTADSQLGYKDEEAVDNCPQNNLNRAVHRRISEFSASQLNPTQGRSVA